MSKDVTLQTRTLASEMRVILDMVIQSNERQLPSSVLLIFTASHRSLQSCTTWSTL